MFCLNSSILHLEFNQTLLWKWKIIDNDLVLIILKIRREVQSTQANLVECQQYGFMYDSEILCINANLFKTNKTGAELYQSWANCPPG